ncbi:MAG: hypothetical protein ABIF77_16550 [bacterium]
MRRETVSSICLCLLAGWGLGQASIVDAGPPPATAIHPLDRTITPPGIHTALVGQEFCDHCHDGTRAAPGTRCLDCHEEIQAGLLRGRGYHFRVVLTEQRPCGACHREHQGQDAKLDTWTDEATKQAFDHDLTGYPLEGGHATLACESCHRQRFRSPDISLRSRPEESFLSLPTACVGCHPDSHTPSLGRECERCHVVTGWHELISGAPADHSRPDPSLVSLRTCIPAHTGRDACRACHQMGEQSDPLPRATCADCHFDAHAGQLADRLDGGRCETCHDVLGFDSVLFGADEHRQTSFPLEGAHRAVPCLSCHPRETIGGVQTVRLDIPERDCADCHTKMPTGHLLEITDRYSCRDCHTPASWQDLAFDHTRGQFKLIGRHAQVACKRCHEIVDAGTSSERMAYLELATECAVCHEGPHADQFAGKLCDGCHTPEDWQPRNFDHQRDSAFALAGKHLQADCHTCHRLTEAADGRQVRRFKPLDRDCRTCHGLDGGVLPVFSDTPEYGQPAESGGPEGAGGG